MTKFDFNIWNNSNSDYSDIPLFVDTQNLFIKDKNYVEIFDGILFDKYTRLDSLIFEKYGGYSNIEQFNVIKVILPLVLLFNDINDITQIKYGTFLKLPEITSLVNNLYIYDENDYTLESSLSFVSTDTKVNLPGLNPINKYNINLENNIDETKTTGIPSIGIVLEKVTYNNETGIVIY